MRERDVLDDEAFPDVLARAQNGEHAAVRVLFDDLQPRILRYLAGVEPRGADDIAGDAWVNIARQLRRFEGSLGQFRAWVFVIVRRRVSDHRRREGSRPQPAGDPEHFQSLLDAPDVVNAIEQLTERDAARLILALLPAEHAEVVLLRIVVGLDVEQVADVVGRTANWVRITQHRALRALEARLGARRRASFQSGAEPW